MVREGKKGLKMCLGIYYHQISFMAMSNKEEVQAYFLLTCIEEGNSFQMVLWEPFPFHNECISEYQWGGKKHWVVLGSHLGLNSI